MVALDTREKSNQYHGQDLLAEETLSVTLNDISSRSEVWAGSNLVRNLVNNSRRIKLTQTWKNLLWQKDLWTKMVGNIMSLRKTNVHYMVPMFEQFQ